MDIDFFTNNLYHQRSTLLNQTLRQNFASYPIEREYPILLSCSDSQYSFCVTNSLEIHEKSLVAHANFWPRKIINSVTKEEFPIALIGNVATDPLFQGKGIMKKLLDHLWNHALSSDYHAIILWSNLVEFYHKLGFLSCGKELRLFFSYAKLCTKQHFFTFSYVNPDEVDNSFLLKIFELRYKTISYLKRSISEFRMLLNIPDTTLMVCKNEYEILGFCIIGKGVDMVGIVHEWGAKQPEIILAALKQILSITKWPVIGLLTPFHLEPEWQDCFEQFIYEKQVHTMSLIKARQDSVVPNLLENGFIWGLDSI